MRLQKTLVLLALTALSAITIFLVLLVDPAAGAVPAPADPDTLSGYMESVRVGSDGDAEIEIRFVLGRGGPGGLLLPFEYDGGSDFRITSGPARFPLEGSGPRRTVLGHRMLAVEAAPEAAVGDTVRIAARVPGWYDAESSRRPFGESGLSRRLLNTSSYVLRDLQLRIVLPPGQVVQAMDKLVPSYDPKRNPTPPYAIERLGDRLAVTLAVETLPPSGAVELGFGTRPARRPRLPLYLGLALAVLYLIFFRDVLKPAEGER
jgi:hypothetical protein